MKINTLNILLAIILTSTNLLAANSAKRPQDMLSDKQNYFEKGGQKIRKGTMAAALANAEILQSPSATKHEKLKAKEALKELVPVLKAFGLTKFLVWKNPEIQKLFEN